MTVATTIVFFGNPILLLLLKVLGILIFTSDWIEEPRDERPRQAANKLRYVQMIYIYIYMTLTQVKYIEQ